jgi:hypothetical protein
MAIESYIQLLQEGGCVSPGGLQHHKLANANINAPSRNKTAHATIRNGSVDWKLLPSQAACKPQKHRLAARGWYRLRQNAVSYRVFHVKPAPKASDDTLALSHFPVETWLDRPTAQTKLNFSKAPIQKIREKT